MGQKLSSLVFNGPRAKTKTVLEMAYKMDPKSSIIQSVSACWCRLSLATVGNTSTESNFDNSFSTNFPDVSKRRTFLSVGIDKISFERKEVFPVFEAPKTQLTESE